MTMFNIIVTGNKKIVNICKNKIEATQDMVNKALEGLCSIPQTKRHAQKFEQSERSGDRRDPQERQEFGEKHALSQ